LARDVRRSGVLGELGGLGKLHDDDGVELLLSFCEDEELLLLSTTLPDGEDRLLGAAIPTHFFCTSCTWPEDLLT
jgi:hypothetical protein